MGQRPLSAPFLALGALCFAAFGLGGGAAEAQQRAAPIVVELAQPQIEIDIGFKGAELLIFGLVEPGADAIVIIRGEAGPQTVRRKERILGVWTTGDARTFLTAPAFYALATSRPLDHIFSDAAPLNRYELGAPYLNLTPVDLVPGDPETEKFAEALLRDKYARGLYTDRAYDVKYVSEQLFRTTVYIPANVPIGRYVVRLYNVRGERVTAQRDTFLIVNKVGLEEQIHRFAFNHGVIYGMVAVALALAAGWLVTLFFRRSAAV